MRLNRLRSIGHNLADALACGLNMPIGFWPTSVFTDAAASSGGMLEVDFVDGKVTAGSPSPELVGAINAYRDALPEFCGLHGVDVSEFKAIQARYTEFAGQPRVTVLVEDRHGHRAYDEYTGLSTRRIRKLDSAGRVRRDKGYVTKVSGEST
jgi:hypothetical protein